MRIQLWFPLFLALLISGGCAPDTECRQTMTTHLNVSYYAMIQDEQTGKWESQAVIVDSLNVWGVGNDSILYLDKKGVSEVLLPLRSDTSVTQFVFQFKALTDTLTVYHTNINNYVSLECGCYVSYDLDTLESKNVLIDSIAIVNKQVRNFDEEHVQIFF